QMLGDRLPRAEHRQHIHEAEHLHLDRLVLHCPGEDAVIPPPPLENRGGAAFEMIPEIAADLLRRSFHTSRIDGRDGGHGISEKTALPRNATQGKRQGSRASNSTPRPRRGLRPPAGHIAPILGREVACAEPIRRGNDPSPLRSCSPHSAARTLPSDRRSRSGPRPPPASDRV